MKSFRILSALAGVFSAISVSADSAFESAFRASLLKSFEEASGKILRLGEAFPDSSYGWRPMEGVISVREVLVHVTETNYALAERLGSKPPAGIDRRKIGDSMQTKTEALAATAQSIEFMKGVLQAVPAEALIPEVNVFGAKAPKLRVALLPVDHAHEHLGQLIAYARMNRVVPPWSK
jgi:uncharacterized damage-inducible protein DinB